MTADMTAEERTELLDWVSACQSSYHIESTPGHRFGGLPGVLDENREALCEYVNELLAARAASPHGWISVKDRLPDDPKQQCLVYWGMSFDVPLYGVATLSDKWKNRLLWRGHGGSHVDVTHWKPITPPQQPQEDSNADR